MSEIAPSALDTDDRLIRESGTEARVAAIITPVVQDMGFRLVRIRLLNQNGVTLQIMAEREDGSMDVAGCEALSHAISPALEVDDPVTSAYHLEVSSPGIDRPLVRKSDFDIALGHVVKLETNVMIEGRKRFKGKILSFDADGFVLEREIIAYGEQPTVTIPYETLAEARLILTDDLIREALSRDNRERKARKRLDGEDGVLDDGEDDIDADEDEIGKDQA